MASASKQKGSTWERDVAKYLSSLFDASFVRTPGSGAYIGGKNATRKDTLDSSQQKGFKGDIIPPEDWKHLNVECKSYADFGFHMLLGDSPVKQLETWIEQCMAVADEGDLNIIFMKITRKGKYVAVQVLDTNCTTLRFEKHFTYGSTHHGHWVIMDFEKFLNNNKQEIEKLCK